MRVVSKFSFYLFPQICGLLPITWLGWIFYSEQYDVLGADPTKEIIHFLGDSAVTLLLSLFFIRLLADLLSIKILKKYKNMLHKSFGLWAIFYALLHILSYFYFEALFDFGYILNEIIHRNYLLIGLLGVVILLVLALSSIPPLRKKIFNFWKIWHNFSYFAVFLVALHYFLAVKSITLGAILSLVLSSILLLFKCYRILIR